MMQKSRTKPGSEVSEEEASFWKLELALRLIIIRRQSPLPEKSSIEQTIGLEALEPPEEIDEISVEKLEVTNESITKLGISLVKPRQFSDRDKPALGKLKLKELTESVKKRPRPPCENCEDLSA
ncbi:hypothetical protein FQR65_LT07667 [Abscondita terminalis]|nr:hypothetical protein FQR65_LT07667 [Abscondita terminalis]